MNLEADYGDKGFVLGRDNWMVGGAEVGQEGGENHPNPLGPYIDQPGYDGPATILWYNLDG